MDRHNLFVVCLNGRKSVREVFGVFQYISAFRCCIILIDCKMILQLKNKYKLKTITLK